MDNEQRCNSITLPVSDKDKRMLKTIAAVDKVSIALYIRRAINKDLKARGREELRDMSKREKKPL
jgi:hypothetical protein